MNEVKKVKSSRKYSITNSYGVKDAYRFFRKIKPSDKKYNISDVEYLKIIRTVNNLMCDALRRSDVIVLPEGMGRIYGIKYSSKVEYRNGKLHTNHPVDFNATLKLWYEHPECMERKQLVRSLDKEIFRLIWDKKRCELKNQTFFIFIFNRALRLSIRDLARKGKYDTYLQ